MRKRIIPLLLVTLLATAACAQDRAAEPGPTTAPPTTEPEQEPLDIDARRYYEEYEESQLDMATGAAPPVAASAADADFAEAADVIAPEPPPEPGPLDDNVFVDDGDSTFVATTDDAESTFGLDVDTGSFSIGRTYLDMGYLPDPDSIRPEEWVNAFDYDDPEPTGGDLGVTVESGPAAHAEDGTALVRIGVSTRDLAAAHRPPANLTFVIDTSGSMDIRERLGLVKTSLALLVAHLRPDDSIAIVTYGDDARPVLPPTPVGEAGTIIDAIDELGPGGSTNMEAGLQTGYDQARAAYRADALNVVVLASDGVANVGVTDATVLTDQITRAGEEGIHLVTVGYGMGNYNDQLMEQLADRGDGFYAYVDTFEEAERLFVDELTPTLTVVAGDAKAQVVFDPEMVSEYRLIGYENRMLDDEDFVDDTVDAGELGAGHDVTALYEVRLADAQTVAPLQGGAPTADAAVAPAATIGEVRLRWESTATGAISESATPIPTPSTDGPGSASFRLAALVANLAELLKGNSVVTARGITLDDLATDGADLAASDLAASDVDGATALVELIDQARQAEPPLPTND